MTLPPRRSRPGFLHGAIALRQGLATAMVSLLALGLPRTARSQESVVRRLADMVGVAVEEYRNGIDANGKMIARQEYDEAVGFLNSAREQAQRLPTDRRPAIMRSEEHTSELQSRFGISYA